MALVYTAATVSSRLLVTYLTVSIKKCQCNKCVWSFLSCQVTKVRTFEQFHRKSTYMNEFWGWIDFSDITCQWRIVQTEKNFSLSTVPKNRLYKIRAILNKKCTWKRLGSWPNRCHGLHFAQQVRVSDWPRLVVPFRASLNNSHAIFSRKKKEVLPVSCFCWRSCTSEKCKKASPISRSRTLPIPYNLKRCKKGS